LTGIREQRCSGSPIMAVTGWGMICRLIRSIELRTRGSISAFPIAMPGISRTRNTGICAIAANSLDLLLNSALMWRRWV